MTYDQVQNQKHPSYPYPAKQIELLLDVPSLLHFATYSQVLDTLGQTLLFLFVDIFLVLQFVPLYLSLYLLYLLEALGSSRLCTPSFLENIYRTLSAVLVSSFPEHNLEILSSFYIQAFLIFLLLR